MSALRGVVCGPVRVALGARLTRRRGGALTSLSVGLASAGALLLAAAPRYPMARSLVGALSRPVLELWPLLAVLASVPAVVAVLLLVAGQRTAALAVYASAGVVAAGGVLLDGLLLADPATVVRPELVGAVGPGWEGGLGAWLLLCGRLLTALGGLAAAYVLGRRAGVLGRLAGVLGRLAGALGAPVGGLRAPAGSVGRASGAVRKPAAGSRARRRALGFAALAGIGLLASPFFADGPAGLPRSTLELPGWASIAGFWLAAGAVLAVVLACSATDVRAVVGGLVGAALGVLGLVLPRVVVAATTGPGQVGFGLVLALVGTAGLFGLAGWLGRPHRAADAGGVFGVFGARGADRADADGAFGADGTKPGVDLADHASTSQASWLPPGAGEVAPSTGLNGTTAAADRRTAATAATPGTAGIAETAAATPGTAPTAASGAGAAGVPVPAGEVAFAVRCRLIGGRLGVLAGVCAIAAVLTDPLSLAADLPHPRLPTLWVMVTVGVVLVPLALATVSGSLGPFARPTLAVALVAVPMAAGEPLSDLLEVLGLDGVRAGPGFWLLITSVGAAPVAALALVLAGGFDRADVDLSGDRFDPYTAASAAAAASLAVPAFWLPLIDGAGWGTTGVLQPPFGLASWGLLAAFAVTVGALLIGPRCRPDRAASLLAGVVVVLVVRLSRLACVPGAEPGEGVWATLLCISLVLATGVIALRTHWSAPNEQRSAVRAPPATETRAPTRGEP